MTFRGARRPWAVAHDALAYSTNSYDPERYEEPCGIAAELCPRARRRDTSGTSSPARPATAKVDVRAAVFRKGSPGDEVLLVRETRTTHGRRREEMGRPPEMPADFD